jgi:hypothetical protein
MLIDQVEDNCLLPFWFCLNTSGVLCLNKFCDDIRKKSDVCSDGNDNKIVEHGMVSREHCW